MANSKKVLLIYPLFLGTENVQIPMNLLHLGTFLQGQGYEIKIIDCHVENDYKALIKSEIANAFCIGISCMTAQVKHGREIAAYIKQELKVETPIVFGGVHPTLYPKQTVVDFLVDYVIISEGEIPFHNLLQALENKEYAKIRIFPGVASVDENGQVYVNNPAYTFDYRDMPEFDYSLINPKVIQVLKQNNDYFPLITSRGCPFKCAFCINVVTRNTKWRNFTTTRTIAEIKHIMAMGFNKVWFLDENFCTSKKRVSEFLDAIEENNIHFKFWASVRANYFNDRLLSVDFLKRLKRLGFQRLAIGFESGSQKTLDYLDKGITVEEILQTGEYCSKAGIWVSSSFMVGVPTESEEDMRKTLYVIGKLSKICKTFGINGPQMFRPYPGSKLYDKAIEAGYYEPKSFEEWGEAAEIITEEPDAYTLPWITNPAFVNFVHFYAYTIPISFVNLGRMFYRYCQMTRRGKLFFVAGVIALLSLSALGKMRYKTGFYKLFFEKVIFKKYCPNQSL